MKTPSIIVVEDEADIADLIKYNLEKEGFRTATVADGEKALERIRLSPPSLVVLDLLLPKLDGLAVCREMMLTARGEEMDKLAGFEAGADDYLTKPFSPREMVARVKALLRRQEAFRVEKMKLKNLLIDFERHEVRCKDKLLVLTPKEFDLLAFLIQNPGRVYSREQLLDQVWGYEYLGGTRTVDVHVRHLRAKLGPRAKWIQTMKGVGYKFTGEKNS
jgi:two-component system, OmpR family, alkaline phosphatase synthesis response regulator PhoP